MLQCGAKKVNPVEPFVTSLPVAAVLPELLTALKTAPQVLLSAPTGAGKSTWLPLQLLQQGPVAGKILLLEPRRLAARNVAQRLAEALNEKPGETVGYRMRAQSCVGPRTRLEVVTEGVLTRMIQRDPELRGVGLVILDEFHERSLQAERAAAQSDPEILHCDLSGLLMEVLQWGCHDPASLFWLDRPPEVNLQAARRLLLMLGALEGERLSARGRKMAAMGNDPRLAAMLVNADEGDSAATAAMLAAILEDPPRGGGTDLSVLFSRRQPGWQQRSQQLLKRLQVRNGEPDSALIMPLLARAFSDRIARRRGQEGRYQLANGMGAMLDADDALGRHEWLIAPLLLQGSASPDARILLAQPLDIASLIQACPDLLRQSDTVEWDEAQGTLKAWRRMRIGQLTVSVQPLAKPSEEELHQAMLNGIRDKGLAVLNWTPEAEQFRLRLHCAAKWLPEYDWPAVDEASLLATLENWLLPHMTGVQSLRSLKSLNVTQALRGLLDYAMLQRLDSELPGHYTVPTGSRITIRYHEDNPPALAVRMQEMFGEAKTPTIAQGRVPLVLELLSPAQRPLQITRDLSAFWQGAYREVQKEMKGRYPKHVWPDDPANTAPTRRTKKYS
ncbi:ATP-dependent helicase HrpB [Salmonella enterica]|nr:ATP-dependent helicase HrpB [Salmonella enterica]EGV1140720.1 ATP-dependent helicase HrpB [Salmonella enterica]